MLEAQSPGQRQPGPSRGDPAGQAERPPTLTAGCLDRPSFGATVDHRAGACGLAQQRRDQLHHARAASEAGADLQAVSTGAGCAPREIDRARRPVLHRPSACAAARGGGGEAAPVSAACRIFGRGRACGERVLAGGPGPRAWERPAASGGAVRGGGRSQGVGFQRACQGAGGSIRCGARRVAARSLPTGRACTVAEAWNGAGGECRARGGRLGRSIR